MPHCSVAVCKNNSGKVNYRNDGISYFSFPKEPEIKEKWINATGRGPNWFPTKCSTICSGHFESKCFQPLAKVHRLFEWAVPTLKLRLVLTNYVERSTSKKRFYSERDKENPNLTVVSNSPMGTEIHDLTFELSSDSETAAPMSTNGVDTNLYAPQESLLEQQENPERNDPIETAQKRELRELISRQICLIKKLKLQINGLQKKTNRYQKKIGDLKEKENVKEKNFCADERVMQLGIVGVTDLVQRYEKNVSSASGRTTDPKYSALRFFMQIMGGSL